MIFNSFLLVVGTSEGETTLPATCRCWPVVVTCFPLQIMETSQKSGAFFLMNSPFPNPFLNRLHHNTNSLHLSFSGRKKFNIITTKGFEIYLSGGDLLVPITRLVMLTTWIRSRIAFVVVLLSRSIVSTTICLWLLKFYYFTYKIKSIWCEIL